MRADDLSELSENDFTPSVIQFLTPKKLKDMEDMPESIRKKIGRAINALGPGGHPAHAFVNKPENQALWL